MDTLTGNFSQHCSFTYSLLTLLVRPAVWLRLRLIPRSGPSDFLTNITIFYFLFYFILFFFPLVRQLGNSCILESNIWPSRSLGPAWFELKNSVFYIYFEFFFLEFTTKKLVWLCIYIHFSFLIFKKIGFEYKN